MKSWRKTLLFMLSGLVVSVLLFTSVSLMHVYRQNLNEARKDKLTAGELWTEQMESHLSGARNQIFQLAISIFNNVEVRSKSPSMTPEEQQTYITSMDEILQANKDLTYFFILDSESMMMLIRAQNGAVTGLQTLEAKTYLRTADLPLSSIAETVWNVVKINDHIYLNHNIRMGKYIIGAFVGSDTLRSFSSVSAHGGTVDNIYVATDDHLLRLLGDGKQEIANDEEGKKYIQAHFEVAEVPTEMVEGEIMLLSDKLSLLDVLSDISVVLILLGTWIIFYLLLMIHRLNQMITKPTETVLEAIENFGKGHMDQRIEGDAGSTECATVYRAFNEMGSQIEDLKIEAYENKVREQSEELNRLRAQIMPHFYLNAINTVANMTYANDNEGIRTYIGSLAKYMRYMMNLKDKTVTLGQELDHISNYLEMQKIRFPNSVDFFILCPDYLRNRDIPYLLLFTLVENTIKHAMDLYSTLELLIQCEEYKTENFKGIRLVVEDNGPGFTKEVMEAYLDPNRIPKVKEHIGLSNVIRTLQLTYHRSDLLRLSNSITGGAHVELLIPDEETEEQVSPEGENHSREGGKTA